MARKLTITAIVICVIMLSGCKNNEKQEMENVIDNSIANDIGYNESDLKKDIIEEDFDSLCEKLDAEYRHKSEKFEKIGKDYPWPIIESNFDIDNTKKATNFITFLNVHLGESFDDVYNKWEDSVFYVCYEYNNVDAPFRNQHADTCPSIFCNVDDFMDIKGMGALVRFDFDENELFKVTIFPAKSEKENVANYMQSLCDAVMLGCPEESGKKQYAERGMDAAEEDGCMGTYWFESDYYPSCFDDIKEECSEYFGIIRSNIDEYNKPWDQGDYHYNQTEYHMDEQVEFVFFSNESSLIDYKDFVGSSSDVIPDVKICGWIEWKIFGDYAKGN